MIQRRKNERESLRIWYRRGQKELRDANTGQQVDQFMKKDSKVKKENAKKHFSQVFGNPLKGFHNEEFMVKEVVTEEAIAELTEEDLEEGDADASLKEESRKDRYASWYFETSIQKRCCWRTGHGPNTNPTQWGHARVNSLTKSKGTWGGADKDLASKVRGI